MRQKMFRHESPQQSMLRLTGTVLVVDTNSLDLETYSDILRSLGHEVVPCASYQGAVRELTTNEFDLVVVDQGGADFEGRIVLEHLPTLGLGRPAIVLARHESKACYLMVLELGEADYFEKPISPAEIKRVVAALVPPRVFTRAPCS